MQFGYSHIFSTISFVFDRFMSSFAPLPLPYMEKEYAYDYTEPGLEIKQRFKG